MAEQNKQESQRDRNEKEKGETFYSAHPAAAYPPVEYRAIGVRGLIAERILWRLLVLVELILLIRLILAGFGANGGNMLTSFLYAISYPFVVFFFYLFNTLDRINVAAPHFEIETLAAMSFYYIIVYIIAGIIRGFSGAEE